MQQLYKLFIKARNFLLYLLLLGFSLYLTAGMHSYHGYRLGMITNSFFGSITGWQSALSRFFALSKENSRLVLENKELKQRLFELNYLADSLQHNEIKVKVPYNIVVARVVNNSFSKAHNYITIKGGTASGIFDEMGVMSPQGVVGVIVSSSENYSVAISMLHLDMRINAKIKGTNQLGTIRWEGEDPNLLRLSEITKYAKIKVGDTIVTGGASSIFPPNIGIGRVSKVTREPISNYYEIWVQPFSDMTNLDHVYVIKNQDASEIKSLETLIDNP